MFVWIDSKINSTQHTGIVLVDSKINDAQYGYIMWEDSEICHPACDIVWVDSKINGAQFRERNDCTISPQHPLSWKVAK